MQAHIWMMDGGVTPSSQGAIFEGAFYGFPFDRIKDSVGDGGPDVSLCHSCGARNDCYCSNPPLKESEQSRRDLLPTASVTLICKMKK